MKHWLPALSLLAACASTSPGAAFRDVAANVHHRSGHRIAWDQATPEDAEASRAVDRLLASELTVSGAVQIALVRNHNLLATYEELSIAQADLVQAGLLKNPVFSARIATAERETLDPHVLLNVSQDFLNVLMLPARKKIAASQLDAVKLRVTDAVLDLQSEVRSAFFTCQGAQQIVAMRKLVADAAQASAELAQRQHDAGNISDLALETERSLYEQIRLDLARGEADVLAARERLTRLMGLWGRDTAWKIASRLPELPSAEVSLDQLESMAIRQRYDLAALEQEHQSIAYMLGLVRSTRWTGALDVGLEAGRLNDGAYVFGPNASIELPIFDQKQAAIARLEALERQSDHRVRARAVEIRSEVRATRDRVVFARRIVEQYRTVLVPLRERIVALSQQQYDAMLLGVYQLLLAKQAEVSAYREYIEAVRDYWIARSDLERAVGGMLSPSVDSASPTPAPAPAPSPSMEHHHHGG